MKRKLLILSVLAICIATLAAGTLAYFTSEGTAHNVITTGGVEITLREWADEEMWSRESHKGICVIDPDTTMPGLSINDFGDSIRFGANHSAEDEKDLSKVNLDLGLYEVFTRGFLQGADGILTEAELEYLPWGARLMTLECGIGLSGRRQLFPRLLSGAESGSQPYSV